RWIKTMAKTIISTKLEVDLNVPWRRRWAICAGCQSHYSVGSNNEAWHKGKQITECPRCVERNKQ
ncbi:MAG: hypothetical protein K8963_09280, partial [Proteobacteria bacterium]|nr:hypothetical protein [Pseudomonadota bacterium]